MLLLSVIVGVVLVCASAIQDLRWLSTTEDGKTSTTNEEGSTTETTASDLFSTTTYFTTTDRLDTSTTEVRVKTHILSEDTLPVVGSELTLVCEVEGYPLPEVSWYKGYEQIFSDDRITVAENRLTVSRVNKNDTGLYRCYAVNDLSSHHSSVLIIVEDLRWLSTTEDGKTSTTNEESSTTETTASDLFSTTTYFTTTDRLDTSTTEVRVKTHILSEDTLPVVGSELTLVCEVEGYPLPEVSWYKGYEQIFSDDRITVAENRLTVSRVNKNDTGLYRCYAVNDLSSHHSSVLIIVEDLRWLSTTEDGKTSTTNEEGSTTETTASDLFSTTTYFTTTDRLDTSTTEVRVKTHILSEDTLPVVGSELTLVCEVEGYPLPEVSWYKGYEQIFSDDRITVAENRLTVSRVNKNDTGLYRCYAVNDLSSHHSSVLIIVEDLRWLSTTEDGKTSTTNEEGSTTETTASDLFSTTTYFTTTDRLDTSTTEVRVKTHILSEDTLPVVGSELKLVCEVEGYPLPEVSWYKGYAQIFSDDRITVAENRLTVSRVNKNDTGLYRCYAVNDLSSHHCSVLIIVEDLRWLSTTEDGKTSTTNEEGSTTETTASDLFSTTTYFTTTDRLDTSTTEVRVKTHILSEDTLPVVGSELTLVCEVEGYPLPEVSWYKGYAQIFSDDRITVAENRLTVSRVNKNDTGLYRCYAVNDLSSHHSSVLIIVEDLRWLSTTEDGKTSTTNEEGSTTETTASDLFSTTTYFTSTDRLDTSTTEVRVKTHILSEDTLPVVGSELTLVCEVEGYPLPEVSWYKGYAQIFSDDRITVAENRLTVSRVYKTDTGLYRCYAVNDLSSHHSSVLIIVEDLRWLSTTEDGKTSTTNEEGSTTETTASDLFSTTTYFTTTDRLDTSTTEVRVKTHILSEDTLPVVGSELTLVCEVEGYPLPEVSWYKGYAQIFSDDRITVAENRLTVSRVNKNDTGLYRCYAVNDLSSHHSSVLIIVEDLRWLSTTEDGKTSTTNEEGSTTETTASDLFSTTTYFTTTDRLDTSTTEVRVKTHILSEDTLPVVGSELTLVCEVEGYPLPEVSWYKGYEQIFSDDRITVAENRLTVSRVNKNDTGLYRCYAVNDLSSHHSSVLIIVEDLRWLSTTEDGKTSTTNEEGSTTETTASDLFSTTTYFTTTDRLDTSTTEVRVKTHILSEDTLPVVGSELTLVCEVEGYPLPEVSWYKGYAQIFSDDRITVAENRLTVSRVNKNDTGLYRCYAVNDLSSHHSSVLIIVEDLRWLSTTEDGKTSTTNEEGSTTETTASDLFSTTTYFTSTDRLDTSTTEVRVKTHILSEDTLPVVGSELTLVCEVEGYPLPEVSWYKGYAQIFSDDRITVAENRLTVSRVYKTDTGLYRCYAVNDLSSHHSSVLIIVEDLRWLSTTEDGKTSTTNEEGSTTETTASDLFSTTTYFTSTDRLDTSTTEVRVKTHILSEDTLPVVGSELTLVCEVEGYPLPEVSWYKGYAQIFSDDRITVAENRLTVSRVNKNDTGLYRCYAVNDLSSHHSSVLIIVEDLRWLSTTEDGKTSTTNEEGSTTETTASDLFSTTTYFTTTDRLDTSTTEVRVKTHILSEDTLPVVGSELTLVCEVEGYPLPEVSWYKGYEQIFSDDRITVAENRLTVSRVNKNDTGLYRCYAVNDLSSHHSSVLIIVEDLRWLSTTEDGKTSTTNEEGSTTETTASDLFSTTTYFTTKDRLDTSTTEVRVKTHIVSKDTWLAAGSELTLVCEVDGYSIPAVFWYKDYAEMSSNDRITIAENRLTVSRVNKNDTGLYRCYAVNDLNSPHSSVLIIVEESDESGTRSTKTSEIREILMSPVPVVTHKAGIQLTLVCEVNGYPVPAVSWYKDHAEISSDDRITMAETRLRVSRLNNSDTGLYECYAANDFNSHYSSVQIIVEGLYIPPTCKDNPYFKCNLIVRSKVCSHKLYSKFCCKSCVEAGQLDVRDLQLQADDTLYRK